MKKRFFVLLRAIAFVGCVCTTGCVHLEQEIRLDKGNTGSFSISFNVPKYVYTALKEFEDSPDNLQFIRFFDPRQGTEYFPRNEGFKIKQYRVYERRNHVHVQIEGKITDLHRAFQSKKLGDFLLIDNPDNTHRLKLKFELLKKPTARGEQSAGSIANAQQAEDLKSLTSGMKLSLKIHVPKAIRSTTAPVKKKKIAEWVFDPAIDDGFLYAPPKVTVWYE